MKKLNIIVIALLSTIALGFSFGSLYYMDAGESDGEEAYVEQNAVQLYGVIGMVFNSSDDNEELFLEQMEDATEIISDEDAEEEDILEAASSVNFYRMYFVEDASENISLIDYVHLYTNVILLFVIQICLIGVVIVSFVRFSKEDVFKSTVKLMKVAVVSSLILVVLMFPAMPIGEIKIASGFKVSIFLQITLLVYIVTFVKFFEKGFQTSNLNDEIKKVLIAILSFLLVVSLSYSFLNIEYRSKSVQNIDIDDHIKLLDIYEEDYRWMANVSSLQDVEYDDILSMETIYYLEFEEGEYFDQFVEYSYLSEVIAAIYAVVMANILFVILTFIIFIFALNGEIVNTKIFSRISIIFYILLLVGMFSMKFNLPEIVDYSKLKFTVPFNMIFIGFVITGLNLIHLIYIPFLDHEFSWELNWEQKTFYRVAGDKVPIVKEKTNKSPKVVEEAKVEVPKKQKKSSSRMKEDFEALKLLKELLDMEAITKEEYEERKKDLI